MHTTETCPVYPPSTALWALAGAQFTQSSGVPLRNGQASYGFSRQLREQFSVHDLRLARVSGVDPRK